MFRFYILFDEMLYEIVSLFSLAVISFLLYTIQKILCIYFVSYNFTHFIDEI